MVFESNKIKDKDEEKNNNLWEDIVKSVSDEEDKELEEIENKPHTKEELKNLIKLRVHKQLIVELNNKKIDLNSNNQDEEKRKKIKDLVEETFAKILSSYGDLGFTRYESQEIVGEILDDALGLGQLEKILRIRILMK